MNTKTVAQLGMLTSVALVLGWVERFIPIAPGIPGIKIGLANTVLLYAVYTMKAKHAVLLMLLKVLVSGLLFSGISGMMYSFAGGVVSLAVMLLAKRIPRIPVVVVSVFGAVGHSVGQIIVACYLLLTRAVLGYFPVMLVSSIITGILTGTAARLVLSGMQAYGGKPSKHTSEREL